MRLEEHFPQGMLQIEHIGHGKYRLLRDFEYVSAAGHHHIVHAGFEFDGETIPVFFWRVVGSPWTGCPEAACFHDKLCLRAEDIMNAGAFFELRKDADLLYKEVYEVCAEHGMCDGFISGPKYYGVRTAGFWGALKRLF